MKRIFLVSAIALLVCATAVRAQESPSTTRIETQHTLLSSKGNRLPQYEENLLKALENENPTVQAQAVQTIRDLEQMYPKYPFKASLAPLEAKLKNENSDGIVRRLAALALDELHSDAGDAVIRDVARSSQDKGLQTLCNALMVRSQYR
jgi:HEAT repeat protein